MTAPLPHNRRCTDCPLLAQPFVPASGSSPCSLMFVGTAPSASEEVTGLPFTGKTGEVIREIVDGLGLTDQTVYANLIPRRPVGPDGSNRKPTSDEIDFCSSHLIQYINAAKPDLIVTVGASPTGFVLGSKVLSMSILHGLVMRVDRFGMYLSVMPVYDPAYLARRGGLLTSEGQTWVDDLQSIQDILRQGVG